MAAPNVHYGLGVGQFLWFVSYPSVVVFGGDPNVVFYSRQDCPRLLKERDLSPLQVSNPRTPHREESGLRHLVKIRQQ